MASIFLFTCRSWPLSAPVGCVRHRFPEPPSWHCVQQTHHCRPLLLSASHTHCLGKLPTKQQQKWYISYHVHVGKINLWLGSFCTTCTKILHSCQEMPWSIIELTISTAGILQNIYLQYKQLLQEFLPIPSPLYWSDVGVEIAYPLFLLQIQTKQFHFYYKSASKCH